MGSASSNPFGAAPASPAGGGANQNEFKNRLTAFYQRYNPSKVGSIDATLAKYKGQEKALFLTLVKKYNGDPAILGLPIAATQAAGSSSQGGGFGGGQPGGGFGQLAGGQPAGGAPVSAFGAAAGGAMGYGSFSQMRR